MARSRQKSIDPDSSEQENDSEQGTIAAITVGARTVNTSRQRQQDHAPHDPAAG